MMNDDIEKVVYSEETLQAKIAELGRQITEDYKDVKEEIFCVGILKGAVMFYTDLVRQIDLPVHFDFMIASSYGNGTSTSGTVKILKDLDYDVEGKHLIIIEDIIDVVDVNIDYCGFEVPDEFLVGYGLDYAEVYRNLPYIGVLKPEIYA